MEDLGKIKKSINDSIDKVINIPKIEVDNFSTQQLKDEVIPLLKDAEKRIYDIENINDNINSIRNEIIDPVNATIREKSEQSNWLSWIGIISGLIGIILTLYSFFSQKIMLSDKTLTEIKEINTNLVGEQVELKARELIRFNESAKYEQRILLTNKTREGKDAMEVYYDYLNKIGYKNILKIQSDSIGYYKDYKHNTIDYHTDYKPNTIPYIYYRIPDVNKDIIRGLEQISEYYYSSKFGNIIGVMRYEQSTDEYIKWIFKKNSNIELLIVL
jgi:hypothetical protein